MHCKLVYSKAILSFLPTALLLLSNLFHVELCDCKFFVCSQRMDVCLSQQEKGKVILMMDGTFGCVRKSSSGRSVEGPKHASRLFLDQFSVDNFVDSHSGDSKNIQLVMEFFHL